MTKFTEIEPAGGDIDWYLFRAPADKILIAEVLTGQLDSLIALFDRDGNLVTFDDDGGAGLLSKIVWPIATSGYYYLAATTFPDFGLTGAGGSGGRYVLSLDLVDGPLVLDLGDDDFEEVPLGFSFPFQDSSYSSVFVNSNGNLTFGSGDSDWSESVSEFLADQPRIAPLWDDLSPNQGGTVTVSYGDGVANVRFLDVPEFLAGNSNNFSVTLSSGGQYGIAYGDVTAGDGLVGTTPGGGIAGGPGAVDLSESGSYDAVGSTYEMFTGDFPEDFDLDFASLVFIP